MGSVNFKVLIRYFFSCLIKLCVFNVLHHLVTYLWTKRYKCCIKSANYVMLTYIYCVLWACLIEAFVTLYCKLTCFCFFCEYVGLNVPFFKNPTCYILEFLTGWPYFANVPQQSILPFSSLVLIFPPLQKCIRVLINSSCCK